MGAIGDTGSGSTGVDADNDGLPDAWENTYGFNPLVADSAGDLDGDGLSNLEEYTAHSNPNLSDTDGDGVGDAQEVNLYFSDPTLEDTDGDGYTDLEEVNAGTSASSAVEYPDWNVTLVAYQSSLHVQNVAGGWHVHSGNATSFSSIGSFSSPPVTTSGDFSSLTGFTYLANPPLLIHPVPTRMGMDYPIPGKGFMVFQLPRQMHRTIRMVIPLLISQNFNRVRIRIFRIPMKTVFPMVMRSTFIAVTLLLLDSDGDGYEDAEGSLCG